MIAAGLSRSVSSHARVAEPRERDHARDGPEHADDHERDDGDREPLARRQPTAGAHRRCTRNAATSSSIGPPLSSSARSTSAVTSAGIAPSLELAAHHRRQPLAAEPRRRRRRCGPRSARRCRAAATSARAARARARSSARRRRRRAAGRPVAASSDSIPASRRSAAAAGGRRAGSRRCRRSGAIVTMQSVVNIHEKWRSCVVHELQRRQQRRPRSRPPSTSVRHAIRRQTPSAAASGPWPETSPITACTVPVGVLHGVVEVAAQQRAPAARAVVRGQQQLAGR